MREIKRISEIQSLIEEIWLKYPDLRYLQLLHILQSGLSNQNNDIGKIKVIEEDGFEKVGFDLFSIEDDVFIEYLKDVVKNGL
ncbi:hypothetical protein [Shewanella woodyi]|uniref:hypothetical protein n=1 Tax=Shewanella woodyi TaxID=60961 RepID=UPI0037498C9A